MALDYAKCAKEIYENLGGRENLVSAAHCATRLRLVTVDNSKIDISVLENIEGVKGVFESNGQLQLIIGTGTVNKVYDEFLKVSGMSAATKDDVKAAAAAKQPLPKKIVKALGDVFVPILPAIVAAGLMMGLVEALGQFFPSFAGSDIYSWMDLVANTAIVYLPVLVAISAARVFGGNIFLAGTIGMLLMHMNLLSAWTAASDPSQIQYWKILCFNIRQVNYQGHIIPIIIAIWLMCQIEKRLHKIVPEMIDLFVTPLVTVFVTAFLTMTIIGPVFIVVENNILTVVKALLTLPLGIGAFVCGAIYPLTVVCGIHHMFNVLEAGIISFVLTYIFWKEEAPQAPAAKAAPEKNQAEASENASAAAPCDPKKLYAPIEGTVIPREEIPDTTFASGVLGDGVGIDPAVGVLVAPCDGEISTVAETKHAVGISGAEDMEILMHVGVDTVRMNGEGFNVFVSEGDKVKKGQKLMTFDIEKIKAAGYSPVTAFLLTNSDDYDNFKVLKTGKAVQGDEVIGI